MSSISYLDYTPSHILCKAVAGMGSNVGMREWRESGSAYYRSTRQIICRRLPRAAPSCFIVSLYFAAYHRRAREQEFGAGVFRTTCFGVCRSRIREVAATIRLRFAPLKLTKQPHTDQEERRRT